MGVLGDDTIVAVLADDSDQADALLRKRLEASGEGPALPDLGDSFVAAHVAPTLLGAWLDRDQLQRALAGTAGRALRGADVRLQLDEDAAKATARVDFEGLGAEELPLPGPGPLALAPGEGVSSASADQSRTTVFLARLARELYPDSRFVRRVERLEAREGLRFEDAVLRQFSGPSLSVLRPGRDGTFEFGARSTLRDPAAMRALLDRIAPDLPGILEGLQGLGSTGLTSLLLVAPDAPLTPAAFALLAGVDVRKLAAAGSEQLYEISGLENGPAPRGLRADRRRVRRRLLGRPGARDRGDEDAARAGGGHAHPAWTSRRSSNARAPGSAPTGSVRSARSSPPSMSAPPRRTATWSARPRCAGPAEVRSRYRAAARPVQARQPPSLFLIVGLPGAGKTVRARELAAERGALLMTPDAWMLSLFGQSQPEGKRFVLEGRLIALAIEALRLGVSVVLDFGLWGRDERSALRWIAASMGATYEVIYLPVEREVQRSRIQGRWERTPEQTFPMTEADLDAWRGQFDVPEADELANASLPVPAARRWHLVRLGGAPLAVPASERRARDASGDDGPRG